jgi:hypothetical protein
MIYGEQGYSDAAAREDARLEAQNEAWAEEDMAMMAADRELDLSPLDSEYPTEASV